VRTLVLAVGAVALGACAEIPTLQFVDDSIDGSTSTSSVGDADAATADDGSPSVTGDDGGVVETDGGDAGGGGAMNDDAGCTIPKGSKGGRCCGNIVCIGDHCNAAQACTACGICAASALCCANGGGDVKCIEDAGECT